MILHSDLNAFYASVELMLNPKLRGKAVAVCGSEETRHGIVLAKSQRAKEAGVKTAMAIWQAKELCPDLIVVPPQYDQYIRYSGLAHEIYLRYTDRMEPFGPDEAWLDLTGTTDDPASVAEDICEAMKSELGLTVSVGVSFNKIFAKLGSDMKKPDAVTVITEENFRGEVWPQLASNLLYCGPATTRKLAKYGIHTIGDIAAAPPEFLREILGVNGLALWTYAAGKDQSRVMTNGFEAPVKSVSHGVTCVSDLLTNEEVWHVLLELAQDVGYRLRANGLLATGVQITIRNNGLAFKQLQTRTEIATRDARELAEICYALFCEHFKWDTKVRALCIRTFALVPENQPEQLLLFDDAEKREKREKLDDTVDELRRRFGKRAVINASLLGDIKVHEIGANEVPLPGLVYA